jgi:hypothetical protein
MTYIYQSLSQAEKIRIFQRCQELLLRYNPESEFVVRRSFLSKTPPKTLETLVKLYRNFNGSVLLKEDTLIFFKILDIQKGIEEIYAKYDKPSDGVGNTILIVFATFDSQKTDIKSLIQQELQGEIQKISFSRRGKFKIYDLNRLAEKF